MARSSKAAGRRVSKRSRRRVISSALETALAALAHDVRTPLNGILALTELLVASELGERERGWAAAAKSAAEHLARYTTVVCDGVRADAAGLSIREEPFSPRDLVEAVGVSLTARTAISGLRADVAIGASFPDLAIGDAARLRAALENLIDNAVKFTARGKVSLHAAAKPAVRGRRLLVFTVRDSGIGLKPSEIKRLFRPFAQAGAAIAERYGGTGLGLTLVRRLAKAMHGNLTVTSKPGRGSTFSLTARVGVVDRKARSAGASTRRMPRAHRAESRKILCIEDNPYGRVVLNTILSELGHRVDFAGTGEAGIAAVARGDYDMVLMDITLPGINGLEAARRIRALHDASARTPLVAVSGRGGAAEERAARAAGIDVYLQKPITPAMLAETIRAVATQAPVKPAL
ncbi:MAG: ATP-binding protein [Pseudorhodoplanes sp.]